MKTSIYKDSDAIHLFEHCIAKANGRDKEVIINNEKIPIVRGSFITSRAQLSKDTGIKSSNIRNKIKLLSSPKRPYIKAKGFGNFTIIMVINYDFWERIALKKYMRDNPRRGH